jgi:hypothetical protein
MVGGAQRSSCQMLPIERVGLCSRTHEEDVQTPHVGKQRLEWNVGHGVRG